MKKILVTGSTGYLGSILVPYLTENGFDVVGYDVGFFKDSFLYPVSNINSIYRDARDIKEADLIGVEVIFM